MTLVDKTNKQAAFIDIAIPLAQNLQTTNPPPKKKLQISGTGIWNQTAVASEQDSCYFTSRVCHSGNP